MSKKTRKLLLYLLVLAALIAVYMIISFLAVKNEEKAVRESEEQSIADTVSVISLDDVVRLSYNNGSMDMSFSYNGTEWEYDFDSAFLADQSSLESFKNAVLNLTAVKKLSGKDTLEAYGLDNPAYTLEITDSQGTVKTLLIGNETGSSYYAMVLDEEDVYTISGTLIRYLAYDLMDFVADISMPSFSEDTVSYIKIDNGSSLELWKNGDEWNYQCEDASGTVTNTAAITDVVETIKGFTGGECQDYNCEEAEKEQYGLDIPYYEVTVSYTDEDGSTEEFKLYVGNSLESGDYYYYGNSESSMVGLIETSYVNALAESFSLSFEND